MESRTDLASLLEIPAHQLMYIVRQAHAPGGYREFNIPKASGSYRTIKAPAGSIRIVQGKLARVLARVYRPKPSVHGFSHGKSIVTNAQEHCNRPYVLCLDLRDFFDTITARRIQGMFSAVPYLLPRRVSSVLARIVTVNGALPQGAPTSPVVSNMLCAKMDSQLQRLARREKCWYTRYADDITISTALPTMPSAIARYSIEDDGVTVELGDDLRNTIENNGFVIAERKTRMQLRDSRQLVTGVVVNQKPNLRRRFVRQIRAMIHALRKFGPEAALAHHIERWSRRERRVPTRTDFFQIILGKLGFLAMVKGRSDPVVEKLYRQLYTELATDDPRRMHKTFTATKPKDLSDEECIYLSKECRDTIARLESRLRGWIKQSLNERFALGWLEEVRTTLGDDDWDTIERRRALKPNAGPEDVLFFSDLRHLGTLINKKWDQVFGRRMTVRRNVFNTDFEVVKRVRTDVMHGRPSHFGSDPASEHRAIVSCLDIFDAIKDK